MRVIQENEGSQRVKYLSHDKLTSTCFYPFLAQKKKVKDHLTPYTVRPVALVRYFSKNSLGPRKRCLWPLNTGDCLIKVSFTVFIKEMISETFVSDRLIEGDCLIEVLLIHALTTIKSSTLSDCKTNAKNRNKLFRAQLLEGRLSLNPGLNSTRVSFSCVQKHFLG